MSATRSPSSTARPDVRSRSSAHSKGGGVLMQLADALPHRCTHLVNLDGLPSRRSWPDVPDHERRRLMAGELRAWLDHHAESSVKERRPGTIDELAERRQRMNPRLTMPWLRYLVTVGAQQVDGANGLWRWKLDPVLRFGGFGPWRPEWSMLRMPGLAMPVLGVLGLQNEAMGWGTQSDDVEPYLPPAARFVALRRTPATSCTSNSRRWWPTSCSSSSATRPRRRGLGTGRTRHSRARHGAAGAGQRRPHPYRRESCHAAAPDCPCTSSDAGAERPLLLLHGLGERAPADIPSYLDAWDGPVVAPRLHRPRLVDDPAWRRLHGRDIAGGRRRGASRAGPSDRPRPWARRICRLAACRRAAGLGLRSHPLRRCRHRRRRERTGFAPRAARSTRHALAPPDPFALVELARDLRPPDYATSFARLATQASPLEQPISVSAVNRPEWLEAVVREPGVVALPLADALVLYRHLETPLSDAGA